MQVNDYRGEASGPFTGSTGSLTGVTALLLLFTNKVAWSLTRISSQRYIFASFPFHFSFPSCILFHLSQVHWCLRSFCAHLFVYFIFFVPLAQGLYQTFLTRPKWWLANAGVAWSMCTHTCQDKINLQCHIVSFVLSITNHNIRSLPFLFTPFIWCLGSPLIILFLLFSSPYTKNLSFHRFLPSLFQLAIDSFYPSLYHTSFIPLPVFSVDSIHPPSSFFCLIPLSSFILPLYSGPPTILLCTSLILFASV